MLAKKALRKLLLGLTLSCAVSFGLTTSNTVLAQANSTASGVNSARSAIEGARVSLSDFDSKLEFPMSEAEKTKSQKDLNQLRQTFKAPSINQLSPLKVEEKAELALKTAKSACQEAISGDRVKALKKFTEARSSLFIANQYLSTWDNRPVSQTSKKLSGSALKEDQRLMSDNAKLSKTQRSITASDSTTVNISPSGIQVSESSGQRTNINMSPSRISVHEISNKSGIQSSSVNISPGGISVRSSEPGNSTRVDITGGTGVNISGLGQAISDLVTGSVGTALGTANSTTQIATGSNMPQDKNHVVITGRDIVKTIHLNGQNLSITGHNIRVSVTGSCGSVSIMGHDNSAKLEKVGSINVTGHDNQVLWKSSSTGSSPKLNMTGRQNQIKRVN